MHIFCDFDGTISTADTTDLILSALAGPAWTAIEAEWEAGAIDAATCMRRQVSLIEATPEELDGVIGEVRLRPGFIDLVRWAEQRDVSLTIVSDGIDYVIRGVLRRYGLALPIVANRLVVAGARTYALEQPHARSGCGSGVCKCAIVEATRRRRPVIFIGDGRSDFCVSTRADMLFATGRLAAHATDHGLAFQPFDDFHSVLASLQAVDAPITLAA